MSSALCDLAMAIGVTFGGLCAQPAPVAKPALPQEDASAWAVPPAPPKVEIPPPPAMPPVVIRQEVLVAAPPPPPPPPEPEPEPEVIPEPVDPLRLALQAAWARGGHQPAALASVAWGSPAISSGEAAAARAEAAALTAPPDVLITPVMPVGPLDLPAPGLEPDGYASERRTSSLPVDNSRIITADRYITGILETGVNSQVGGEDTGTVIIQTARDVYGYHSRLVLLPKGSRLICDYMPPADMGSTRLDITCRRVLIAGHRAEIRQLESQGADVQGRAGVTGEVDKRFWERYGTAFMLTGISTAVRLAAATTKSDQTDGQATTAAAEKAAEELGNRFGEITASVLEQSLSLTPIITIPQGTRIQIRPAVDWYIAKVE